MGELWRDKLQKSMAEAGRELAEVQNEYHEGGPAVTVMVDGASDLL